MSEVYFIQAGSDGPIKIGFARDAKVRMAALQESSPFELTLLCAVPGDLSAERGLHAKFASGHLRKEWFAPDTPGLLDMIEKLREDGSGFPFDDLSPLVEARYRAGKSQEEVARDLGVSERTIRRLEKKEHVPRKWRVTLAAYYGVDITELDGVAA